MRSSNMSLKDQIFRGVFWTVISKVIQQTIQFFLSVSLARLLAPGDFGLIAMVAIFTGFTHLFADFGFGTALIQRQKLTERHIHSIFWINLGTGALLTFLLFVAAPHIAAFFQTPVLTPLCRILAFNFILGSFLIVPNSLMHRRMSFRKLAKAGVYTNFLSGGIALLLAIAGWGVWSLVAQILTASIVGAFLHMFLSGWYPRFIFSLKAVKELFHFGFYFSGFCFVNYWHRNMDNLIVGKVLGPLSLGIYSRAYSLMLMPMAQIIGVVSGVMFPALSSIQHDKERVKRIYLKAMSVIALSTFPILMGLYVVAEPFILSVFGPKWKEVIPILQILCIAGIPNYLCNPLGWIYTSQGRTDRLFHWSLFGTGVLIAGIVTGALFGTLQSIAVGYTVAMLLVCYPCIQYAGVLIDMSFKDVVAVILGPFWVSLIMAFCVGALGRLLPFHGSNWTQLSVQIIFGALIYGFLTRLLHLKAASEAWRFIREGFATARE